MNVVEAQGSIWESPKRDAEIEGSLRQELGLPPLVAAVLASRGLTDAASADKFLNPSLDDLHSPTLLPDYEAAARSILLARDSGEKIFVHGDYDVDGVSSTALLTRFLKRIGCDVVPHVPHRMKEGYGIHIEAVKRASESGAKLFLTCDCGVSAHEQVDAAREAGMRVVVTDHHEIGEGLPNAEAVVNPHRSDSMYPFDGLSGVGVAFKLCAGLTGELGHPLNGFYRAFLDLAVLGTVADVMPLVDENRTITKFGLQQLSTTKKVGLRALMDVSEVSNDKKLTARTIGFQLGPRINAVGRIDDASYALKLLLTDEPGEARQLAETLDAHNRDRRSEQNRMFEEAVAEAEEQVAQGSPVIVLAREGWHSGIIGIVAGKIVERFHRPAFVVSIDSEGNAKGSARSVDGFNLAEAIEVSRDLLTSGGGHEMAAGFSLPVTGLSDLREALSRHAGSILTPEHFLPHYRIDAIVTGDEASQAAYAQLSRMEPFGHGNPEPLFATMGARILEAVPTSNPDHCKVTIEAADGTVRKGMAFGIGRALCDLDSRARVDLVFCLEENHWNGSTYFRWIVRDYRLSDGN